MTSARHSPLDRIVGPFADLLLTTDLPHLPHDRRAEVVQFVQRRAEGVPSLTRFGVTMIGVLYRVLMVMPFGIRATRMLMTWPLPVLGEYPRLVRSLGYAYIWERWPDTLPDGTPA